MISVIIVVSWSGHNPLYSTLFIRACASFSDWVYVLCPEEADPIAELGAAAQVAARTTVLRYASRYPKSGCRRFRALAEDLRDLHRLTASIAKAHPEAEIFIFHSSLDLLFSNVVHLPLVCLQLKRLFPVPFSGEILAPDRHWPLRRARGCLDRVFGKTRGSTNIRQSARRVADRLLALAEKTLRRCYLRLRNCALKRSRCEQVALTDERYIQTLRHGTGKSVVWFPDPISMELATNPWNWSRT